jgi:FtsP/CotA-like multicopper oxidase with cupredoxin domain
MNKKAISLMVRAVIAGAMLSSAGLASATVYSQCPGDLNGDGDNTDIGESTQVEQDFNNDGDFIDPGETFESKCMHLTGSDGYIKMADERPMYMFGFGNLTGTPDNQIMTKGVLAAEFPAPNIELKQGERFYLTLSNVGMVMRPDLFDPHTVHFHGFPNASSVFDGLPDTAVSINMGASITYYYNVQEPGTYMYHCHVEATEHMQMGMLGNLYVHPAQNDTVPYEYPVGAGRNYTKFVYNDGDGSTGYDVEVPIQMGSFDSAFHDASEATQPLPFAEMVDNYPMLNGRGYPDTVISGALPSVDSYLDPGIPFQQGLQTQPVSAHIEATQGQKILLRLSNLNVTRFYSLNTLGIPMQVVGVGAKQHIGPAGDKLYYKTNSVTLGGGEALDVMLDTADVAAGTYYLYTGNLNYLSNGDEDFGGMMTKIIVNAAPVI